RLSVSLPGAANRRTNPVRFLTPDGKPLYSQPPAESRLNYLPRTDSVGKGYMDGNTQVNQPMDFSGKNRVHLADLHRMLQTVLFPEAFPEQQRFRFSEDDYRFLYQCLSQLPRETRYPEYDTTHYYDSYVKFFLYGTQKQTRIPPTIRIFNKVGWSYGFLTDVAYIADLQNGVEFMLSATIYCNADGILNDDRYEYETVGLPFLEALGRQFYEHELQRKKKRQPDLSRFRLQYEK
ncbi:MAG TPA: hypothetical protein PKE63_14700, partial [Lacibacter sp.]|nr:hypothetical protein [Lacibacter sp.]